MAVITPARANSYVNQYFSVIIWYIIVSSSVVYHNNCIVTDSGTRFYYMDSVTGTMSFCSFRTVCDENYLIVDNLHASYN